MRRRLWGLVRKEFTQIGRDRALLFILLWTFTVAVYAAGKGGTSDVSDIPTGIFDLSRSPASRELVSRLQPPYFKKVGYLERESDIGDWLNAGRCSIVVVIPPDFQRALSRGDAAHVQVLTDGALAIAATVSVAYIAAISGQYAADLVAHNPRAAGRGTLPQVDGQVRVRFNPNMLSTWFGSLLELMNMFAMVSLLLTAANLVREKEHGTLERLLASPATPLEVFLSKIAPTIVIVLALSALSFLVVLKPIFHVPIRGSLLLFYSGAALFVFAMTSIGIAIAVVARNLAQAVMIMILTLQPMVFLSGAWNPPEAMIPWLRVLGMLSPLRYFIDFGYGVILKGNTLPLVLYDLAGMALLGSLMFTLSLTWFTRRLA